MRALQRLSRPTLAALFVLASGCTTRADLDQGRYYTCDRAAGNVAQQCPGSWVCTLDGTCQDPDVGAPLSCAAETDCTGGWHCGVDQQCYDRTTATDVKCRLDQPDDCAPDWKCGLEGVCHDTSVAAAYRCDPADGGDSWCSGGWRCGPSGSCVDSRAEALRAGPDPGAFEIERLSPTYPVQADEVALTSSFTTASGSDKQLIAMRVDGGVWFSFHDDYYGAVTDETRQLAAPGATAIATVADALYYADGAGVWLIDTTDSVISSPAAVDLPGMSPPFQLRAIDDLRGAMAVFSGTQLALLPRGATTPDSIHDFGAGNTVTDVFPLRYSRSYNAYATLVSTAGGVFVAYESYYGDEVPLPTVWRPVELPNVPNAACSSPPVNRPGRIRAESSGGDWTLVVELIPAGGGPSQLEVLSRPDLTGNFDTVTDCASGEFTLLQPPFDICSGGTLVAFDFYGQYSVAARCRTLGPTAVEVNREFDVDSDTGATSLTTPPPVWFSEPIGAPWTSTQSEPNTLPVLEPTGRLGTCGGPIWYAPLSCQWTVMDRAPGTVIDLPDGGYAPVQYAYDSSAGVTRFTPYAHYLHQWGFSVDYYDNGTFIGSSVENSGDPVRVPCSQVRGDRSTIGYCQPQQDMALYDTQDLLESFQPTPLAILNGSATKFVASNQTLAPAVRVDVDGGQLLVVAAFDTLWEGSTEVGGRDGGIPRLSPRVSPNPSTEITALTMTAPPAGDFLDGYVIAGERVFHLGVPGERQWFATPITLPEGRPIGLWSDGPRARVGFDDGRVYSLPSGVLLADTVPGGMAEYGEMCGTGYGAGANALFQLTANPDGGAVGVWRPVSLAASGVKPEGIFFKGFMENFADGEFQTQVDHLHDGLGELLLTTEAGAVIRVRDPACPVK